MESNTSGDENRGLINSAFSPIFEINVFYAVFLPFLSVLMMLGNIAVITAFVKVPGLREKPSDLLILNLSVTDLIQGVILLVFLTPLYVSEFWWHYGEFGCKMLIAIGDFNAGASLFTLCAISLDRVLLVAMEYPRYMKLTSRFRIMLTILISWISALVPMSLEIGLWEKAKEINLIASLINFDYLCLSPSRRIQAFSSFFFFFFVFTPVIIVTTLSLVFMYFLHQRLKKNRKIAAAGPGSNSGSTQATSRNTAITAVVASGNNQTPPGAGDERGSTSTADKDPARKSDSVKNRYIKPAVTLAVLIIAMIVCLMPYVLYVIIGAACPSCVAGVSTNVVYGLVLLQYCNSLLDPFLYAMTQSKIKRFYQAKLQHIWSSVRP